MTERLSIETRKTLLQPLFNTGWEMVESRDAIHKTFKFKDFAEDLFDFVEDIFD